MILSFINQMAMVLLNLGSPLIYFQFVSVFSFLLEMPLRLQWGAYSSSKILHQAWTVMVEVAME
jgi:hypothetical protein